MKYWRPKVIFNTHQLPDDTKRGIVRLQAEVIMPDATVYHRETVLSLQLAKDKRAIERIKRDIKEEVNSHTGSVILFPLSWRKK